MDIKYVLYNGFDKLCCSSIAFVDAPIDLLCVFNTTFNNISLIFSVTIGGVMIRLFAWSAADCGFGAPVGSNQRL
jgi:hypothetical protein